MHMLRSPHTVIDPSKYTCLIITNNYVECMLLLLNSDHGVIKKTLKLE